MAPGQVVILFVSAMTTLCLVTKKVEVLGTMITKL